jgi:hypothetical protein
MKKSGIYIVRLLNEVPMPVTRDPRHLEVCARVNRDNVKVGKAKNFNARRANYWSDFDKENVIFEPLTVVQDIKTAEAAVLDMLGPYRIRGPQDRKLEWLEDISYEEARGAVFEALGAAGIEHAPIAEQDQKLGTGMLALAQSARASRVEARVIRNTRPGYEDNYRIARRPNRPLKRHNAVSWDKVEKLAASKPDGKVHFDELSLAVDDHQSGSANTPHAYQFIIYCVRSGWLERVGD